jgi:sugar/nucleoside kinase (ribokinase family)
VKIVGLGFCPVDYYHYCNKFISFLELPKYHLKDGGGSTANTLCLLSSLYKYNSYMIGNVGSDKNATFVENSLKSYGISKKYIFRRDRGVTQRCHCLINDRGERNFFLSLMG